VVLLATLLAAPALLRTYWERRASNPVRRGVARARQLGCFSCHGNLGASGVKDPGGENKEVPAWSGVYMMYVDNDNDIRRLILDGSHHEGEEEPDSQKHAEPEKEHEGKIEMPPFRDALAGSDLEDLTSAFKVLSGMVAPASDTPEERGFGVARTWSCFACHGPGGSGGLPNPGSLAGFIPGWYGADFSDLVRDRGEFDSWVRDGGTPRVRGNPVARYFMTRQRIQMPAYSSFKTSELDDLWAYVRWLDRSGGGIRKAPEARP
jgi:cytochrome c553